MAFLFVDCLTKNRSRFVQILVKIVELLLLSVGFIYTFVWLKVALLLLPYSRCYEIVFSILVGIWTCIRTFFCSPLSICIFIHVTVAFIAASSILCRLQTHNHHDDDITVYVHQHAVLIAELLTAPPPLPPPPPAALPPPPSLPRDIFEFTPPPPPSPPTAEPTPSPLLSHSANHSSPDSPDEREREEEDTMEATWMAIRGRLNQKPKKNETWEPPLRRSTVVQRVDLEEVVPTTPKWKELRKAETFSDAVSIVRRGGLRRDPSMSMEEFNQQVENFIKKFNDSMRLQRQESNYRFLQMINRRL